MINLSFASEALPEDTFQVLKFDGEEEMSHLFRFELVLVSRDPNIDFEQLLNSHASLAISTQGNTRYIHGMLSEFEQAGEWHGVLYEYRAVLVPRLWMLSQSRQNQIYQEQTVPAIVEGEIGNIQNKGGHPLAMTGLDHADYEMHIIGDYDEREYVVQYRESDFNFISRLMEHVGIYYYFEHDETREKIVITDAMVMKENAEQAAVGFQHAAAASNYAYSVVYNLRRSKKQIPGSVLVKDYNYRSPSLPLHVTDEVDANGIGFVTEYGAHFKSPEEGQALVSVRAEEFRCRQNVYSGESNVSAFHCGHVYSLANHFRDEYNRDYLITKVVHHASQDIESSGNVGGTSYHNEFSCIPADIQYRPERLTPKPRLYGIMNGTIDSEQDMDRADLDEEGRYKVLMPFDISGTAPGKASRRIRMAQPYGGHGAGMSFPLVKGTEVIWTCIDGDIDRPIITGAVPNPLNPCVTNTDNHSSNVIKTSSGITMSFHDGSGSSTDPASAGGGGALREQHQHQNSNAQNHSSQDLMDETTVCSSGFVENSGYKAITQQQQMVNNRIDLNDQGTNVTAKQWNIGLTYGGTGEGSADRSLMREDKDVFFRLGEASSWENGIGEAWGQDGLMSYVDGNRNLVTKGDDSHWHYGSSSDYYKAAQRSCFNDDVMEFYLGHSYDFKAGVIGEVTAGVKSAFNICPVETEINLGFKCSMGAAWEYNSVVGSSIELAGDIRQEANQKIQMICDPDDGWAENIMENWVPPIAAAAAAGTVAAGVIASLDEENFSSGAALGVASATYAIGAVCAVGAIAHAMAKNEGDGASRLNMDPNNIDISVIGSTKDHSFRDLGIEKKKPKISKTTYKKTDDKIVTISALSGPRTPAVDAVKLTLKAGGINSDKDSISLVCGKGSSINMNDTAITFTVGQNSVVINKDGITFSEDVNCQKSLGVVEDFVVGKTVNIGGDSTLGGKVKVCGELDAATIKNSAITANAAASAANTSARDKLEKDIKKLIKDNTDKIETEQKILNKVLEKVWPRK